ncbi:ABC transporter ATP-binding protein [Methyloprofundus sedimenti]|uniref:ABC transporter ATP-binding protein n=1 Tax=Methyloprofundus sedimenti TaxID=1420851 RepID=A0A1V8MB43_9GAMM|nr:ATP-binding cassette domain-containing protein [Methyloprofundus sedimenti]OQK18543.1 ABC transporter ATP-binding protein [Methyloprofundus sedimenti]
MTASDTGEDVWAVEIQQLSKQFTNGKRTIHALQDVSLTISKGEVVGLIGPDGAGKTTLLRLVAGLLVPSNGTIHVFGLDSVQQGDDIHHLCGYMPQRFGLYEDLSVAENLNLYADLHGVSLAVRQQRFQDLMRMTGLAAFTQRLAGRLSGGMKQKLGLACTLLSQPGLLLLDEPSVGVDPVSRRELWSIIEQQVKSQGMTVLLSTAYMDEAERCQQVVILDEGVLVDANSPDLLKSKMQGHCYRVSHPELSSRLLQSQLIRQPNIIDAVIQGEKVRIIHRHQGLPVFTGALETVGIAATPPRLEDVFISLLRERHPAAKVGNIEPSLKDTTSIIDSTIIHVEGVDRWFDDFQAVKKLNFSVKRGEIFGLLGANGAGKTTTFRMLCGLLPASNGELRVAGVDIRLAPAKARSRIGYMSQKFSLYANLSVLQNLTFFSSAYGLSHKQRDQRIQWALQQFELSVDQHSECTDLPLGYKQRLAMACALMHEPDILFLDEPTSGVDPLARREFWNRTNQLAASGVTVLVTTHFMEEAEYCDRLLIMCEGSILITGTPAEIKQQVSTAALPDPTMEDAFIQLVEARQV